MRKILTSIKKYLTPNGRRLTKRVERMEGVIGNIVSKIDRVLIKLETMEKSKSKKKQNLGKLFDGLTNDEGGERSYMYTVEPQSLSTATGLCLTKP